MLRDWQKISHYLHKVPKRYYCSKPLYRALFFGSDSFALRHLQALDENRMLQKTEGTVIKDLQVVISSEKCPVARYAIANKLPIHQWPIPTNTTAYDVGIIVSFGHLIPKRIINMFPCGMLNVHPSKLPKYRGAAPILHTILNGDTSTALSIMKILPKKFDIGPVLAQEILDVTEKDTVLQLSERLSQRGSHLLLEVLKSLPVLEPIDQKLLTEFPSSAPKLSAKNAVIDWERQSVYSVDRQYKTLGEIYQLRSAWHNTPIKLLDMLPPHLTKDLSSSLPDHPAGSLLYVKRLKALAVKANDGWVAFERIVYKKPQTAEDFYNGYLTKSNNNNLITLQSMDNGLKQLTAGDAQDKVKLPNR